nr:pilus assembly protein TadG-related protein [Auraticoccus cholistanensis]
MRDDRGAVNVVVALLMIPLIGFAAIAVDVAALWSDRQQLQTGADAAALAIAQDCARGSCGAPAETASTLTSANFGSGEATATVTTPSLSPSTGQVTVVTGTTRQHLFAPVLGFDASDVGARATARWGAPSGGTAVLPLAFSLCEFRAQTGGGMPSGTAERVILTTKTSGTGCTGPSGNVVPGGFGWLDTDLGSCGATGRIGARMSSDPGTSAPSGCSPADFEAVRGRTVLLPIFDEYGSSGTNAWYRVHAYAAFTVTGYHFTGQISWNGGPQCKGNDRCIKGYFTRFVDLDDAFESSPGAPDLGASLVSLTE